MTITATANDLYKKQASVTVRIRDYEPRISTNTVTLNPAKTVGEVIRLYPAYDNEITEVKLMENGELSTRFEAKQTGEICLLDKTVKTEVIKVRCGWKRNMEAMRIR